MKIFLFFFFISSRRRHTRCSRDWSSDVCSSDLDHGTHAVVMTGYTATRSPLHGQFSVLSVQISDPIGLHHYSVSAASSPLDRYYQLDATTTYDKLWYGKFIIIAPQS